MANVYRIIYQVRKPASNNQGNVYVREPQPAVVLANDQAGVFTAVKNNITLGNGEVFDLLRVTQDHAGGVPAWQ